MWFLPESPIYLLKLRRFDELKEALFTIADWNGTQLEWDRYEFETGASKAQRDELAGTRGHRRPDKAENVLRIMGLPYGSDETEFREFLAYRLEPELLGLVYYCTLEESGTVCYLNFITHKAMHDAKNALKNTNFNRHAIEVDPAYDITRTELIATTLKKPMPAEGETDEAPPLSFFLSFTDVKINIVIMVFVWLITVFNFYLIGFLVNTFEQIFYSTIASGVSEFVAQAFGGYLYAITGTRDSLFISYAVAALGGFAVLFYGLDH